MDTISQIAEHIKNLLESANQIGRDTGFIKRNSKLDGSSFGETLILGFLSNPEMTYSEMSQTAAVIGRPTSAQGIEQRFCPEAAEFMKRMFEKAVKIGIKGKESVEKALSQFEGVYIRDSSVIVLPRELTHIWRGAGGSKGENAALKLQVNLNYKNGELFGPVLQNGRDQDKASPFQDIDLPKGALRLGDLGYFELERFSQDTEKGVYWVTRYKYGTVLYQEDGTRIDILHWLESLESTKAEIKVFLGKKSKIPCRLLIIRVPQEVAEKRRHRMREAARKQQKPIPAQRLALAEWTLMLTNVPTEMLTFQEVLVIARIRWQVELLFKLWKSHAKIDEWRSKKPWRILCEIYAKLIGLLFDHWIMITSLWDHSDRSLFRAIRIIQKFGFIIALTIKETNLLKIFLEIIVEFLSHGCRIEKRKKEPSAFQLISMEGLG